MSNQGFPKHLISGRWIKSQEAATVQEATTEVNNKKTNESEKVVLKEDDINELIVQMESETQKHRYLKIFHKGKELSRLASNNGVTTIKASFIIIIDTFKLQR